MVDSASVRRDAAERALERARQADLDLVHLQFTDVSGTIKMVSIPSSRLGACLESGLWFDGSSVEGAARMVESDLYLKPDPNTFALLPWESTPTARLICDIAFPDGTAFPADPRGALKRVLGNAEEAGFDYAVRSEVEFFLFEDELPSGRGTATKPSPIDISGYFEVPSERAALLCFEVAEALASCGIAVEATHHEVAQGQHEIDLGSMPALTAADAIVALKWALKALARRAGLRASFMPKPLEDASGSGLHLEQVLRYRGAAAGADANAFFDAARPYCLSSLGEHFIGGQLAHARGMCAVLAPLVNSYKRLAGGSEAPSAVTWARVHRNALIRVPSLTRATSTRVELRAPDPSCNPYLAFAGALAAGLDGMGCNTKLPEPMDRMDGGSAGEPNNEDYAPALPQTLGEALEELEWDPVIREALGQPIVERFLAAKDREWHAYRRHISQWEIESYLHNA